VQIVSVYSRIFGLFCNCINSMCISRIICIRVAVATEEVVFEVVTEPQEQLEPAQEERRENPAPGPVDPSAEQQPEGKPRCMTY